MFGVAGSACNESHVDEVKAAGRQVRPVGVALPEFDILRRAGARDLEKLPIHVETYHASAGAYSRAQEIGDAPGTAPEVEARPTLDSTDAVQRITSVSGAIAALCYVLFEMFDPMVGLIDR